MAKKRPARTSGEQRPQRTREHVVADLAVNFVERFILEDSHSVMRVTADYGYDLIMQTFDEEGYAEEGFIYLQLKATDSVSQHERADGFAFPIDMRHYHLWRREPMPVFLILYDASRRRAYWLHTQAYFASHASPKREGQSLTIHFPRKNILGKGTMRKMRQYKANVLEQVPGGLEYHG